MSAPGASEIDDFLAKIESVTSAVNEVLAAPLKAPTHHGQSVSPSPSAPPTQSMAMGRRAPPTAKYSADYSRFSEITEGDPTAAADSNRSVSIPPTVLPKSVVVEEPPELEVSAATAAVIAASAEEAKAKGNAAVAAGKWDVALAEYDRGLVLSPKNLPLRLNRALARMKKAPPDAAGAASDAAFVLAAEPTNVKAHARFAAATAAAAKGLSWASDASPSVEAAIAALKRSPRDADTAKKRVDARKDLTAFNALHALFKARMPLEELLTAESPFELRSQQEEKKKAVDCDVGDVVDVIALSHRLLGDLPGSTGSPLSVLASKCTGKPADGSDAKHLCASCRDLLRLALDVSLRRKLLHVIANVSAAEDSLRAGFDAMALYAACCGVATPPRSTSSVQWCLAHLTTDGVCTGTSNNRASLAEGPLRVYSQMSVAFDFAVIDHVDLACESSPAPSADAVFRGLGRCLSKSKSSSQLSASLVLDVAYICLGAMAAAAPDTVAKLRSSTFGENPSVDAMITYLSLPTVSSPAVPNPRDVECALFCIAQPKVLFPLPDVVATTADVPKLRVLVDLLMATVAVDSDSIVMASSYPAIRSFLATETFEGSPSATNKMLSILRYIFVWIKPYLDTFRAEATELADDLKSIAGHAVHPSAEAFIILVHNLCVKDTKKVSATVDSGDTVQAASVRQFLNDSCPELMLALILACAYGVMKGSTNTLSPSVAVLCGTLSAKLFMQRPNALEGPTRLLSLVGAALEAVLSNHGNSATTSQGDWWACADALVNFSLRSVMEGSDASKETAIKALLPRWSVLCKLLWAADFALVRNGVPVKTVSLMPSIRLFGNASLLLNVLHNAPLEHVKNVVPKQYVSSTNPLAHCLGADVSEEGGGMVERTLDVIVALRKLTMETKSSVPDFAANAEAQEIVAVTYTSMRNSAIFLGGITTKADENRVLMRDLKGFEIIQAVMKQH